MWLSPRRPQVHAQADDPEEDGRQHAEGHRLEASHRFAPQAGRLVQHDAGHEGPENGVDADLLGGRRAQKSGDDDDHQVAVGHSEVRGPPDDHAQGGKQHESGEKDERGQHQHRHAEVGDADRAVGGGPGDQGEDDRADGVVHHPRREDDEPDVPLREIEVDENLGDHRHRRDRHGGGEKQAEEDAVARIGEVPRRHHVAEAEAEPERQHHPHHRGDEGGATEISQEPHVGLQPRDEQQEHHSHAAEGVEQVEMLDVGGEQRGEGAGGVVPKEAGSEGDAGPQLPHHGRQPRPFGQLRAKAGRAHQKRKLNEQQVDGVAREGGDGRVQGRRR